MDPETISKCPFPEVGMELMDLHLLGKYFITEFYFHAHALALDQKEDNLVPFASYATVHTLWKKIQ